MEMTLDKIIEIAIDKEGRLCIKPATETFSYIWRSAAEVHWENNGGYLFSPKPREWTYLDWYKHIINVTESEYGCKLQLTMSTRWLNVPTELRLQIMAC